MAEVEQKTQEQEVKTEALAVVEQAKTMKVTDDPSFRAAVEFLKEIKTASKKVTSVFKPMKEQAKRAHQVICDTENAMIDPLEEAEVFVKKQLGEYTLKVEQEQEAERKRLQMVARGESDEATLEAAYAAEQAGAPELAQAILKQEPHVPAVVLPQPAPAVKGFSTRKKWTPTVVNLRALVAAVFAGKVPIQAIAPNDDFLRRQAQAMGDALNYPGVKVTAQNTIAVRTGK